MAVRDILETTFSLLCCAQKYAKASIVRSFLHDVLDASLLYSEFDLRGTQLRILAPAYLPRKLHHMHYYCTRKSDCRMYRIIAVWNSDFDSSEGAWPLVPHRQQ